MSIQKTNPAHDSFEPLILTLRGHRVIVDADLARIYEVSTSRFNEAFRRNQGRFPSDFAFQLTEEEFPALRSQFAISNGQSDLRSQLVTSKGRGGRRYLPWAFTEHGVLMAANVLRSARAAEMSVYVVRAFVRLRQYMLENEVMSRRLAEVENNLRQHDYALVDIYDKLEPLLQPTPEEPSGRQMGFQ